MDEKIIIAWKPAYSPEYLKAIKPGDIYFYNCSENILLEFNKWIYFKKGFKCFENKSKAIDWNGENFDNYIDFYCVEVDDIIEENKDYIVAQKVKIIGILKYKNILESIKENME